MGLRLLVLYVITVIVWNDARLAVFVGTVASKLAPIGHDQLVNIAENSDKDLDKIN